ncbi:MAG: peptidylprolyl isomerase [Rhodospirillales bacterium]
MRVLKAAVLLALGVFAVLPGSVRAQELRIVAVINDDVISAYDLGRRLRLVLVSIGVPINDSAMHRMAPQVLRLMIDEKIKHQEAQRLNIKPDDNIVQAQLAQFERQNGIEPGALADILEAQGASIEPLTEQVETETTWSRVVALRFGGEIKVSDRDIDADVAALRSQEGQTQYRIAEIFIPHEGGDTKQSRQTMQRLQTELRNGADFAALARNFSRAPSAAEAGDLGFIQLEDLGGELSAAARPLEPGGVSPPIETPLGIYLLHMIETRVSPGLPGESVYLRLSQYHAETAPDAGNDAVKRAAAEVSRAVRGLNGCEALEAAVAESASPLSGPVGTVALDNLPDNIRAAVENLPIGRASPPVSTPTGVVALMVCERQTRGGEADLRENLKRRIQNERLADFARQYLRDLKRTALVEIRQ